jgi:hypothetical protein
MNSLKSEKTEEIIQKLFWHVSGEWNVKIPVTNISRELLLSIFQSFRTSFKWLDIHEADLWLDSEGSDLPFWKKNGTSLDQWIQGISTKEQTVNYNTLAFSYNCYVDTPDKTGSLCAWENNFGYADTSYDESGITLSFCFYINLFTPEAYIFSKTQREFIDIGKFSRKHNRKCLAESIQQFTGLTNGKVTSTYTESSDYINLHGFDEKCESFKPNP